MHLSSPCDLSWCLETISAAAISSTYSHLLGKLKLWEPDEILDVDGEVFSLPQQGLSADERDGQLCDRQKPSKPSRPGSSFGINRTREILCPPRESLEHVLKSWQSGRFPAVPQEDKGSYIGLLLYSTGHQAWTSQVPVPFKHMPVLIPGGEILRCKISFTQENVCKYSIFEIPHGIKTQRN